MAMTTDGTGSSDADLLREQLEYYNERAPEYDEMVGEIERTAPADPERGYSVLVRRIEALGPLGRVLELAPGTGLWTKVLAPRATSLTAVDGAPGMVELNRRNVGDPSVRYVTADLFPWEPDEPYDLVFFGYFLSHVPPSRFDAFWRLVERATAPGGRFFCIDTHWDPDAVVATGPQVTRTLRDGRAFRIVKVLHRPEELAASLEARGWSVEARSIDDQFFYATGTRP
jgi:SAM-dependent methyltransferase